ncbi:MAG TPA: hypothetical protein VF119_11270 [Candidatus Limnocylindrales bacterium]
MPDEMTDEPIAAPRTVTDDPESIDHDADGGTIDLGASAQQVALIETGGGLQHGLITATLAVVAAIVITPIARALRRWFRQ